MLGQTLAQNPQAQATPCRRRQLVRTCGGEAQTQGQTPQEHNAMAWTSQRRANSNPKNAQAESTCRYTTTPLNQGSETLDQHVKSQEEISQ